MSPTPPQRAEAILVCNEAAGRHWQLGPLPRRQGEFALVGWTERAEDGGVPASVAGALARGLTSQGCVTFPCSAARGAPRGRWVRQGDDHVGRFSMAASRGWRAALPGPLGRTDLPLLSTRREEAVLGLFDDADHPWWLQGQFALLSPPAAASPRLGEEQPLPSELVGEEWASCLGDLAEAGVVAILRPGVDGDVAGLASRSPDILRQLLEHVRRAAADFGLAFHAAPEDAFMKRLSAGSIHPG